MSEGIVLLKNNGVLPMEGVTKINLFGRNSADPVYGGGGGAGVTVTPVAFVVVDRGGARILPINVQADSTVDRLVEMIPDAVSKVSSFFEERKNKGKDDGDLEPDPEI